MAAMRLEWRSVGAAVFLALCCIAVAGCGGNASPTNTGFNGTWSKETSSLEVAIYLWHDGREYRFRMLRESRDGTGRIGCDWDGHCEEFLNDSKTSDLRFRLEENGSAGSLLLHCDGLVRWPKEQKIQYTHELKLSEDGLTLLSYTIESQGIRYEEGSRGMRELHKISDAVPDPPSPRAFHD